ncbi:MAG TPA: tetratricopeptide repeat protein, partial [Anaerolineales bacterium]|nr:tetratricopeptide repeat protein [Anaerolineales bacterium]
PTDVEVHTRRAAALWSAGRRAEAIGAWQKVLYLVPDDLRSELSLARALLANGEVQEGLNLYAKGLTHHPGNRELLVETGLATLRHGSSQEAIDLLTRAAEASPDGQTLAALGEAWLRQRRPERAFEVLSRAVTYPQVNCAAWALYSEAAAAQGDLAAAEFALGEARRADPKNSDERTALARAELRLAHWNDALTALTPVLSTGEPQAESGLAETIVRILEARWLFGEAAMARRHGPSPDVPSPSLLTWLETWLAAAPVNSNDALALRLRLARSADDDEALAALQADSGDAARTDTMEALAIAQLRRQRFAEALDVLRRAQPDSLGASWQAVLAGLAHLQTGNPSLARQAFVDAAEDAGLRPVAQFLLARAQLAQGYTDSAIAALNTALAEWNDEPAWHAELADLYQAQSDLDAALPHLQAAVEAETENAVWRLGYGRALRSAGHLSAALQAYQRLLPLMPSDAEVWHEAGQLALACGDSAQAETLFDHAASLAPEDPSHQVGKAKAAMASGKLREARHCAEEAVRLGAHRAEPLECLAAIVARQGEADRAIELLDRAAPLASDASGLRRTRARLLIDVGRAAQASEELRSHLATQPDDDEAWSSLGEALEAAEDYPAAGQALEAALRLRPRAASLHVRLGRVQRKLGQLDRALDLLRQGEALDPLEPGLDLERGQIFEA